MQSITVKNQVKTFGPKPIKGWGPGALIKAEVRWDDECGNRHNSFSVTGTIYVPGRRDCEACGCLHEEIAKAFPELAHLIKWHLCGSEEPTYYVANTLYHALEHGPKKAWLRVQGVVSGLPTKGIKYGDLEKMQALASIEPEKCSIEIDVKTAKVANLKFARSTAVWPEATDDELTAPGLEERLGARLPELMRRFKADVESLGFVW